ncbi:MAG: efflux RND transporter permease subunit [Calditrichaeota bacterium]|nr:efflux RND transporter permease subunit [Calditrichota bacterium]
MNLPELGVRRPVTTLVVFVIILILGLVSLSQLGIDLMPDITLPAVSITTTYPGAGPEDVETRVTRVIEDAVSTVPNVDKVTSTSQENISATVVYFKWGTNIDAAAMDVRDKLGFYAPFLPEDASDPLIFKFDASLMPILFLGISADESFPELQKLVDDKLCDPIRRVAGVGSATVFGGLERQINVRVDAAALQARGLSIDMVTRMLQAANINLPAGSLKAGSKEYIVRLPGEFRTVQEIGDVAIGTVRGVPIYLRDVATIEDGYAEVTRVSRMDGKRSVMVIVQKQSGANTVAVTREVWKKVEEIRPTLPKDVEVKSVYDGSTFIKQSIAGLATTVIWASILVVLVVLLFLRNLRASFIIAFVIPFSLVTAFILLRVANYTINIMSLSSVAIAIGMVVDNAIVIFENIYRHRTELEEGPEEGAVFGAREVAMAVTASTLTTVVIFVPLLFVQGIAGILFRQLGYVLMFVLGASLFTSLYLTPMLSAKLLRVRNGNGANNEGFSGKLYARSEQMFRRIEEGYRRLLGWALRHKLVVVLAGLGIFVISMGMLRFVNTEFFPQTDESQLRGVIELPVGTNLETTDAVMRQVEEIIAKEVPERQVIIARCGTSRFGMGASMGQEEGNNVISVQGTLVPRAQRSASDREIGQRLSKALQKIPGLKTVDFSPTDPFMAMFGGGKPIEVEVYGYDLAATENVARQIQQIMAEIKGTTDVVISREEGKPEYWVVVDRAKAAALGLSVAQVGMALRTSFYGSDVVKYREAGDEYPIFVQLREEDRKAVEDIGDVSIMGPTGTLIPLKSLATIEKHVAPVKIDRKNQQRLVTVSCGVVGRSSGAVGRDLKKALAKMPLPRDIEVKVTGAVEQQASSFKQLLFAMALGMLLVYLVMAAQFESLIDPFVIMFSVPFAATGVIWALLITGTTLSVNAFIGMIMLVGIVVNNAIVLVDYTNLLRARGMAVSEAVQTAGQRRLRPVLMTALTTIFGLLPMALSRAEGSETWVPLAVAVIGGLLVSTLITLVFVPTLYSIAETRLKRAHALHR